MRRRSKARELALKFLYQIDITKEEFPQVLEYFWREHRTEKAIKDFTTQIIQGTLTNLPKIDNLISKYAQNWQLRRMAVVDRNVLRLASFELLFLEDIPSKVSINEAVELAKKYGDVDSSKFVNGILDKICKEQISKSERTIP